MSRKRGRDTEADHQDTADVTLAIEKDPSPLQKIACGTGSKGAEAVGHEAG